MLPQPGIYYFPWEVGAGLVPDGNTLRTFGRLCSYDLTQSRVTLMAQHRSDQHRILVCTKLVEPFQAQVGSLYTVLGELERQEAGPRCRVNHFPGRSSKPSPSNTPRGLNLHPFRSHPAVDGERPQSSGAS
ncbi:CST complex subunit TEN1 isoform X1 [Phacochoerus africanus]|uniref:CST complex subunit TEN1 isoform X1 n=1 Tax=Phacochoerus africanus TaxID=41426 RepID=UPI001FDA994A|nr:CST complex subunit TEN1 isoform X1 [Phacochoerus africanus]XP_047614851.1 CST complex subunit TEN1 isoform X1 [Phacochoerus africanus]